jgi:hypothetical protein
VPELRRGDAEGHLAACHFSEELVGFHSKFSESTA